MKSIALKLWAGMMALVAIVLVLLWLFQIVFLNSFYTGIRINETIKTSQNILQESSNLQQIEVKLDEFAYNNNLTAELMDLQQNVVYKAGTAGISGMMPAIWNTARAKAYEMAQTGQTAQLAITHPRFNSRFMLISMPVNITGKLQGVMLITLPIAPVEETANILKQQLVYITLILLFATLLLSFLLSKSFTRPILDINKVTMDMASGNLSARLNINRKDEIGKLAQTINYMGTELSKTEQLRKDLIANVSHELRTPLSLIKGYAETIRDISGNDTEKREKQLGIIIEESDRLSSIVGDILNLSQMQAGYNDLKNESFKINEMLERLIKRYEILSERTGVKIVYDKAEEFFAEGDEAKIEQVMYNLVNNAFNHSPEGSTIHIKSIRNSNKVRVEVADSGEGIPADELKNIWERFYKIDKSGNRKRSGTGLGLAIVKSILDAHKAIYGVDSKCGEGTTFWFELTISSIF